MRRYSATYFIGQSFKGLWKNGVMTFASILVLLSCLVVMGSFSVLVININQNMQNLGVVNKIVTFIDENKTADEINSMYQTVKSFSGVSSVESISKEDALKEEKTKLQESGYENLVESLNEENNPYRASFIITYTPDASLEDLQYKLGQVDGIDRVKCYADIAETVNSVKNGIAFVLSWFMITLFVVSIFVIINTIKLAVYSRRHEITVMRYIGATSSFITIPFIFEGVIIGLISSVGAYFVQQGMYTYIYRLFGADYGIIRVIPFSELRIPLLIAFLCIGVVTGIMGSCISLRKYLKA